MFDAADKEKILYLARTLRLRLLSYHRDCPVDFAGCCGAVSVLLARLLRHHGWHPTFGVSGLLNEDGRWVSYHVFVLLGDRVLDLTARQFEKDFADVVFRPIDEVEHIDHWNLDKIIKTEKGLVALMKRENWWQPSFFQYPSEGSRRGQEIRSSGIRR